MQSNGAFLAPDRFRALLISAARLALSVALLVLPSASAAIVEESLPDHGSLSRVEDLSARILERELDLLRLNIHFKMETGRLSPWKSRRWTLYSAANSALNFSGLLGQAITRFQYENKPRRVPLTRLEHVVIPQLVAASIGVVGPTLEFALDAARDHMDRKHGFDLNLVNKRAHELQNEMDRLIALRQTAIDSCPNLSARERELAAAEGVVLKQGRDLSVGEFVKYYSKAKASRATRNLTYLCSASKDALGVASGLVGLYSLDRRKPKLSGQGAFCTTISGSIIMAAPFITRAGGGIVGAICKRRLSDEMQSNPGQLAEFDRQRCRLRELLAQGGSSKSMQAAAWRADLYDKEGAILETHAELAARQKGEARGKLVENVAMAEIGGGSKVTHGVLGLLSRYRYQNDARTRFQLSGAGSTTYAVGSAIGALEAVRVQVASEVRTARLRTQHQLPSQILQDQLSDLEKAGQMLARSRSGVETM